MASNVEIALRTEADLARLFALSKDAFGDLVGWSDERVLDVLDIADSARSLRIVVEEANQPAQSFYTRSGFVPSSQSCSS